MKKTGKGKTALWQVHFTFKNRSPISQSFSDKTHGGKDAALVAAQRFRNALEQEFAAADVVYGHTGSAEFGEETGISRSKSVRGSKVWWYWQATWPTLNGKQINRKFHDLVCGGEDASKKRQSKLDAPESNNIRRCEREGFWLMGVFRTQHLEDNKAEPPMPCLCHL